MTVKVSFLKKNDGSLAIDLMDDSNPLPMINPGGLVSPLTTIEFTFKKESWMDGLDQGVWQRMMEQHTSTGMTYVFSAVNDPGFTRKDYSDWIADALDKHLRALALKMKVAALRGIILKAIPSSKRGKRRHRYQLRLSHLSK